MRVTRGRCAKVAPAEEHSPGPAAGAFPGKLEATLSVLNAIVGDYLRQRGNDLEIEMGLYHANEPLACDRNAIARAHPAATAKLCVLLHGLAVNEGAWSFPGQRDVSYGTLLARDLGYTPFHVRYNTGLHISDNGRSLARLLTALVASYPVEVREIVLVGHSMGGLVVRSACEMARIERRQWLTRVAHAFYLGTPHLGAPLERVGNVVACVLSAVGVAHTSLIADVINLRSAGIKDLRYANLTAADWEGHDPDALLQDHRQAVPLDPGISHHFLVGAMGAHEAHVLTRIFGDGMVPVPSAAHRLADGERSQGRVKLFPGIGHVAVAHHPDVYEWIRRCCASARHIEEGP